jgi:hypothetical protein
MWISESQLLITSINDVKFALADKKNNLELKSDRVPEFFQNMSLKGVIIGVHQRITLFEFIVAMFFHFIFSSLLNST